jgi:hypothetical protein
MSIKKSFKHLAKTFLCIYDVAYPETKFSSIKLIHKTDVVKNEVN